MGEIHKIKIKTRYKYKNQLDENDNNLYTQKELEPILKDKYNLTLEEYYNIIVHGDKNYPHVCRNPECGKPLKFLGLLDGYHGTCNRQCADRYHSYHMVEITKTGCYIGTSHFIKYNSFDSTRDLRKSQVNKHKLDKTSKGFGSEYQSRLTNCQNILARYGHDDSVTRYLYLFDFPDKIKIGSTVSFSNRSSQLKGEPLLILKGKLIEIAYAEMDILRYFIMDTLRDENGKFTEYLPKEKTEEVIEQFMKLLDNSTTIEKIEDLSSEIEVEYTASLQW